MKRNWDLIRKILLKLEEKADIESDLSADDIRGFDRLTVSYHYNILAQAGLIEIEDNCSINDIDYTAKSLTWQGHELLDNIRNDSVWNKVKSTVRSKSLDLSFDVIKQVATAIIGATLR